MENSLFSSSVPLVKNNYSYMCVFLALRERALSGDRGMPKGTPGKRAKWHLGKFLLFFLERKRRAVTVRLLAVKKCTDVIDY